MKLFFSSFLIFIIASSGVPNSFAQVTGPSTVCIGAIVSMSDATSGGVWSSSNGRVAIVGSTGAVTGVTLGTATISYSVFGGYDMQVVSVTSAFSTGLITPEPAIVCRGNMITLTDDTLGGAWSSSNPSIGSVSASGVVTGLSIGNTIISYTITKSCGSISSLAALTVGNPVINTFAGNGTTHTVEGVPATASGMSVPTHLAFDNAGNMYFGDYGNNLIRKISTSGIITTIAGNGDTTFRSGTLATSTGMYHTAGLCVDGAGNIFFSDYNGNGVRRVNPLGMVVTIAGTGELGYSGDGGLGVLAKTSNPWGVAADNYGNVYFCDRYNNRIRKVSSTDIITTYAGNGTDGHTGDGGPATAAEIGAPVDLAIDPFGNLYFTTWDDVRVRMVDVSGNIHTIAGTGIQGFSGDGGPATAAELGNPVGICLDSAGNIFIGDYQNNRVREISTSGIIKTIAGNGAAGYSGDSGPATAANLYIPYGLAVNGPGILYICDGFNNRIRQITVDDATVGPVSGLSMVCAGASISLSEPTSGGTWSSSATGIATIGSTGKVYGVAAGSAIITYTVTFSCGNIFSTKTIVVNPSPGNITGTSGICMGSSGTLFDTSGGGTWSSASVSVTIGSVSGIINSLSVGTAIVTYTLSTGCSADVVVTVNPLPSSISGNPSFCAGDSSTLSDVSAGGTWVSSNTTIATVGSLTGVVTGISPGSGAVTYTLQTGCLASVNVTVNPVPPAIAGTPYLCMGAIDTLSDSYPGGTWTSRDVTVASIGPSTGIVTGDLAGTTTISYSIAGGCAVLLVVTVNPTPGTITGALSLCSGTSVTLGDGASGGKWSSGAVAIATVGSGTGMVTGISAGTVIISYILTTGCSSTRSRRLFVVQSRYYALFGRR